MILFLTRLRDRSSDRRFGHSILDQTKKRRPYKVRNGSGEMTRLGGPLVLQLRDACPHELIRIDAERPSRVYSLRSTRRGRRRIAMATRFLNKRKQRFSFTDSNGAANSYWLIFGDEVTTAANGTDGQPEAVRYRERNGTWNRPPLTTTRALEMYFLDVGQGDAAFIVTPNGTKVLVDGGLKARALEFLIWKYRLDRPGTSATIDHLFLSHADKDHIQGLIPLLNHPRITVGNIYHNGIGVFGTGFFSPIGDVTTDDRLITLHDTVADLAGQPLAQTFGNWIQAVRSSGATYGALDTSAGTIDIGDPDIQVEILGPRLEPDGQSLRWFSNKAKTINGHSVVFRLTYGAVRTFFSGDLNIDGSEHLLTAPNVELSFNSHIFKAPHHGSHEYSRALFDAVQPMITVVSSGDSPDHGHPRASFLGAVGLVGRGDGPLVFSTEIAATFLDAADAPSTTVNNPAPTDFSAIDFSQAAANSQARERFKKVLPGIINVRTDGQHVYAFRRVQAGYQWEAYGPITPVG